MHPEERAAELLRLFRDLMLGAPDELSLAYAHLTVPEDPDFPAELHGRPAVAVAGMWAGDVAEGERVLRELRALPVATPRSSSTRCRCGRTRPRTRPRSPERAGSAS